MTIDGIDYLNPDAINGLNLYAYCGNNPVKYLDLSGQSSVLVVLALMCVGLLLGLKGDSYKKYESEISINNLNINGSNPMGDIEVHIDASYIQIVDSKDIKKDADMIRILELIMESEEYKYHGYNRTLESYKSEWRAHNFAYSIYPFGEWGKHTRSVDLNKNLKDDPFRYLYWLF